MDNLARLMSGASGCKLVDRRHARLLCHKFRVRGTVLIEIFQPVHNLFGRTESRSRAVPISRRRSGLGRSPVRFISDFS